MHHRVIIAVQIYRGSGTDVCAAVQIYARWTWYRCTYRGSGIEVRMLEMVQHTLSGSGIEVRMLEMVQHTLSGSGIEVRMLEMVQHTLSGSGIEMFILDVVQMPEQWE